MNNKIDKLSVPRNIHLIRQRNEKKRIAPDRDCSFMAHKMYFQMHLTKYKSQ